MSTFDIKKFLINEGMTRVSRDRKRLLKEYYTTTINGYELDSRNPEEVLDYIEKVYGYRPDPVAVEDFFSGYENEDVYDYLEDSGLELDDQDEEMFDLYFNPERGYAEGWCSIMGSIEEVKKDHKEPAEPYDPKKDSERQENERANRIHREGMPENTPRQDGLNKNGGHKNNRR